MRELFLQIVYGRTQSAFSDDGLAIGAGLEDLRKRTSFPGWYYVRYTRRKVLVILRWQKAM